MTLTHGSLFSGLGGFDLAAERAGMRNLWSVEIDPIARSVLARHWPDVPRADDVQFVSGDALAPVDVITAGFPCFPAGTLILCADGFKPIESVAVGDRVLTHHNRWRPVVRVGGQYAPTVQARGVGHWGMETTADHPFLALASRSWSTHRAGISVRLHDFGPTEWVAARDLAGKRWASPTVFPACDPPEIPSSGRDVPPPPITVAMCWVLGAWLGDGWTQTNQRSGRPIGDRRGEVFICGVEPQIREIVRRVEAAGYAASLTQERTVWRARIHTRALAHWLDDQFGRGAAFKRLPPWVLGLPAPMRQALLDGYLFADGSTYKQGWKATTVSRALAVGIRLLALSLGWQVRSYRTPGRGHTMIEGRRVRERATYQLVGSAQPRAEIVRDGMRFGLVRSVRPTGRVEPVFNLEVDGDNSYIADGMAVHNCQDLSIAGKRGGLEGARSGLFHEIIRIVREMQEATGGLSPAVLVLENVPGLLSSNGGRDFAVVLGELARLGPVDICWRVLDARYFGVAQRRRRVFVVVGLTSGCATPVLIEPDGLSGHPAPRREAWQAAPAGPPGGTGDGGGADLIAFDWQASAGNDESWRGKGRQHIVRAGDYAGAVSATRVDAVGYQVASAITASAGHHGHSSPRGDGSDNLVIAIPIQDEAATHSGIGAYRHPGSGIGEDGDPSYAVNTTKTPAIAFDTTQITSPLNYSSPQPGDPCHPLAAGAHPPAVAVSLRGREGGATAEMGGEVSHALRGSQGGGDKPHVLNTMTVRRFNPARVLKITSVS